jgi:hypothetical protein
MPPQNEILIAHLYKRADTVPSIVGRPTGPPVSLLMLAQVVSLLGLSGLVVPMSFPVQCQSWKNVP